jgi:hypothetical protein
MSKYWLLLVLTVTPSLSPVHAQLMRILPPAFERGETGAHQPLPLVRIGSRTLRLAPGAVIFDRENRSIVHEQLPVGVQVLYTKDQSGDIQRLYVLTEHELQRLSQAGRR